jgi:hypothetical protein
MGAVLIAPIRSEAGTRGERGYHGRAVTVIQNKLIQIAHQAWRLLFAGLSKHCSSTLIPRLRARAIERWCKSPGS